MQLPTIDLADIAELPTRIAMNGAIGSDPAMAGDLFGMLVGIATLIDQTNP
jgi:hypothetical protein